MAATPPRIDLPPSLALSLRGQLFCAGETEALLGAAADLSDQYQATLGVHFDWAYASPDYESVPRGNPRFATPRQALFDPRRRRAAKREQTISIDCQQGGSAEELTDIGVTFSCRFSERSCASGLASFRFDWPRATDATAQAAFRDFFLAAARRLAAHGGFGAYHLYRRLHSEASALPDLYAAARRYPGVHLACPFVPDYGLERGNLIGDIGWLNVLGPTLIERVGGRAGLSGALAADGSLHELPNGALCAQAGDQPLTGDSAAGDWAEAYGRLARQLEAARVRECAAFFGDRPGYQQFDADGATEWLRRFDAGTDRDAFFSENTSSLLADAKRALTDEARERLAAALVRLGSRPLRLPDLYSGLPDLARAALARGWRVEATDALDLSTRATPRGEICEKLLALYREDQNVARGLELIPRALPLARRGAPHEGKPFPDIFRHAAYLSVLAGQKDEAIRIVHLARAAGRAAFLGPLLADRELVAALGDALDPQALMASPDPRE